MAKIDFEQELYKAFGQVKDFTLCMRIAKRFYEMGVNWQKEHLWKDAQGDDLPEIDREVIAIIQDWNDAGIYKVVFAHRPNPEGWDGKSLSTGEISHYEPKTYDKGGWNMSDVVYWLDTELPKAMEE